ncbi:SDR family NAD(P)-dependent oxidoreductase [Humibacter sp.]|uniref:SDR family NAD(P)-dependent oxidoreductase n=1 Tax=Humibacter sp. TaxID=1940291 RepID=UPI002CFF1402|nr:SDR family NAD(P)-dependent oxidoreductase [Humibacter sp.]HVX09167.1 SDR family NAD(P)-dependent oxidoreductase [Humibacter sp.]
MKRFEDKVVLITGAARGQGRSHAMRVADEGAHVVALDICATFDSMNYPLATDEDLALTVKEVEARGRRAIVVKGDVRIKADVQKAVDQAWAELGRLDVVVANAGVTAMSSPTPAQAFIDGVDVDLVGVLNTVGAALRTFPSVAAGRSSSRAPRPA